MLLLIRYPVARESAGGSRSVGADTWSVQGLSIQYREVDLLILFAWSFAAATVLPLSSEIPLLVSVRQDGGWALPVAVATAGNFLGACTTYWLARAAVTRIASHRSPGIERASAVISRYGPPALLLSWVPLLGDTLVALAGAASMSFWRFAIWTAAGKAGRYMAVAWIALRALR